MIAVPDNNIALIPHDKHYSGRHTELFESLDRSIKRDWFIKHAYFCLPLAIGNQYGFILKSLYDFTVRWNGGVAPNDVSVQYHDKEYYDQHHGLQSINPHFGMGTLTVQTNYTLRTPAGINLITGNPPNYYIDGITHMTGVIETDNLRRDFTYNLKITRPDHDITIKKGDWIGYFIPYPRHFIDKFKIVDAYEIFDEDDINQEQECMRAFGKERQEVDSQKPNGNGRRYWRGEDVYSNKFQDHQRALDKNHDRMSS